jgi:hypothetical protein
LRKHALDFFCKCVPPVSSLVSNHIKKSSHCLTTYCILNLSTRIMPASKKKSNAYKKKPISKTLKMQVWSRVYGMSTGSTLCPFCRVITIYQISFDACHIWAESKGGPTIEQNLLPGCHDCNMSFNNKTMKVPQELQPICKTCKCRIDPLKSHIIPFGKDEQPLCSNCNSISREDKNRQLPVPIKTCCVIC